MITPTSVTTSPTLLSAAKPRSYLLIQNLSDAQVYVALDGSSDVTGAAGAKPGFRLEANGGSIALGEAAAAGRVCNTAIYATHESTGNKLVVVQEN